MVFSIDEDGVQTNTYTGLLLLHILDINCKLMGKGRAGQGRAGKGRAGQGRAGQGRAGQGRAGQGRVSLGSTMVSLQKKPLGSVMLNVAIPPTGSRMQGVYTTMLCSMLLFTCKHAKRFSKLAVHHFKSTACKLSVLLS